MFLASGSALHLQEVLQRVLDRGGRRLPEQRGGHFPLDPGQLRHLQTHQPATRPDLLVGRSEGTIKQVL